MYTNAMPSSGNFQAEVVTKATIASVSIINDIASEDGRKKDYKLDADIGCSFIASLDVLCTVTVGRYSSSLKKKKKE